MIRLFDIVLSSCAIILVFPVLVPIVILLKLTGEHDIFYRQIRNGRGGKPFYILKFATMLRNSPHLQGGLITTKNDPRILPLGHFLRKTKINELPQLLNVLLGDMSLIGYRPFAEDHYKLYPEEIRMVLGLTRPGLSGIGSIIFKNEEQILHDIENSEWFHDTVITSYKGKLEKWYVEHKSILTYFILILLTFWAFIRPQSRAVWKIFKGLPPIPAELRDYL